MGCCYFCYCYFADCYFCYAVPGLFFSCLTYGYTSYSLSKLIILNRGSYSCGLMSYSLMTILFYRMTKNFLNTPSSPSTTLFWVCFSNPSSLILFYPSWSTILSSSNTSNRFKSIFLIVLSSISPISSDCKCIFQWTMNEIISRASFLSAFHKLLNSSSIT